MSAGLEQQLDSLWEQSRARKFRRIEDMNKEATTKVATDLEQVQLKVRAALEKDRSTRRQKMQEIAAMEADFVAGVELWHRKSQGAVEELSRAQADLSVRLTQATERMAEQKLALQQQHLQRHDRLRETCQRLVAKCSQQIDASSEL